MSGSGLFWVLYSPLQHRPTSPTCLLRLDSDQRDHRTPAEVTPLDMSAPPVIYMDILCCAHLSWFRKFAITALHMLLLSTSICHNWRSKCQKYTIRSIISEAGLTFDWLTHNSAVMPRRQSYNLCKYAFCANRGMLKIDKLKINCCVSAYPKKTLSCKQALSLRPPLAVWRDGFQLWEGVTVTA